MPRWGGKSRESEGDIRGRGESAKVWARDFRNKGKEQREEREGSEEQHGVVVGGCEKAQRERGAAVGECENDVRGGRREGRESGEGDIEVSRERE